MMHYFFTRIACDARTINPNYEPLPFSEINDYIDFWLNTASKFYEAQTVEIPFKVVLRYSDMYRHLMQRDWPAWCEITAEYPHEWIACRVRPSDKVSFTRLDADDSYSRDFFEWLKHFTTEHENNILSRLVLYKSIRQLGDINGITKPMWHESPMFSTLYFPSYPWIQNTGLGERHGPKELLGLIGNHGKFPELAHDTQQKDYALMRITGRNKQNRMGLMGRVWHDVEFETDPKEIARYT